MSGAHLPPAIPRISLTWLLVAQALVIVPHLGHLPLWVIGLWLGCAGWRVQIFRMRVGYPTRLAKGGLMLAAGEGRAVANGQARLLGVRLAFRPAPVQITYLGLPATTGFPFIDHVIADRFLIPPELAHHYSEKPLYMPDIYQVSDRQRTVGPVPTRAACGLPPTGTPAGR